MIALLLFYQEGLTRLFFYFLVGSSAEAVDYQCVKQYLLGLEAQAELLAHLCVLGMNWIWNKKALGYNAEENISWPITDQWEDGDLLDAFALSIWVYAHFRTSLACPSHGSKDP